MRLKILLAVILLAGISPARVQADPVNVVSTVASVQVPLINFVPVRSMKLLAPNIGWAATEHRRIGDGFAGRLWWTANGGRQWKEITPSTPTPEMIAAVFFLNTEKGWVLAARTNTFGEPEFDLASTANAGATWTIAPVAIPDFNPRQATLAGGGHIAFADSVNGWMNLDLVGSSAAEPGILLTTSDGGATWSRPPRSAHSPYVEGSMTLATPDEGWLAAGVGDKLYATFDGTRTWRKMDLKAPQDILPASDATYQVPIFSDERRGFLPVTYSGGQGTKSAAVLFETEDGGRTWQAGSRLAGLPESSIGQSISSTVVETTWIVALVSHHMAEPIHVTLTKIGARRTDATAEAAFGYFEGAQLSFVTPSQGWLLSGGHRLLSTDDGGATWTPIAPRPTGRRSG